MKYFYSLLLLSSFSISAQVANTWVARYDGTGNFDDKVTCSAKDNAGNFFVGGYSMKSGNEKDYFVAKLNSNGDTVWTNSFDGNAHGNDAANDIAFDPAGFVYTTGYVNSKGQGTDLFAAKLNATNGDTIWTHTYNYTVNKNDEGRAVAFMTNGNVVVTGQSDQDPNALNVNLDYVTISYSATGIVNWIKRYNGTALQKDSVADVVMESDGTAIITGESRNTDDDFVTIAYNTIGTQMWIATYDGGGGKDKAYAMVEDPAGNIYVTGESNNGNDYDYGIVKYSPTGTELWRNFYDFGAGDDKPVAIALNSGGDVIVTGKADTDPLLPVTYDILTVKWDAAGNFISAVNYNGLGSGNDEAADIVVDANDNEIITGKTDIDASAATNYEIITLVYDNNDNYQWSANSGVATSLSDAGVADLVDPSGNIIVSGNVTNLVSMKDIRSIKYSIAGATIWTKDFNGTGNKQDVVNGMTADAAGNSYMCGSTYTPNNKTDMVVSKMDPSGNIVWTQTYDGNSNSFDAATAVQVDASGNVYVTGYVKDTLLSYNFCTIKYNSAGVMQWATRYNNIANGSDKATALLVNASGEVFVTGESDIDPSSGNNKDFMTVKYNAAGVQQWAMNYGGSANLSDKPYAMAFSPTGEIVVAGKISVSATDDDAAVVKYSAAGAQLWSFVYISNVGIDAAVDVAVDNTGNVGLAITRANTSNNDIAFAHLDPAGNDLGMSIYNGTGNGNDIPAAIAFDGSGNAYITGQTDVDTTTGYSNYDIITLKYNSTGMQQWAKTYAGVAGDDDNGIDLVTDNSTGYVYVTGLSQNGTLTVKNNDMVILQYDPAGNQQLFATYDGATKSDVPTGIYLQGNKIFLSGTSVGPNNNQKDMVMILYTTFQVGISSNEIANTLSVYPNPCSSFTEIHFDNASTTRIISLVDVNGKTVFTESSNEILSRIETSQFAKGIYFGTVAEVGKSAQHFKIVVE